MAHKTLINGTAYEISGGRTIVNGTGYSIDKGKTLVGGTAYEVGFGVPATVTFVDHRDNQTYNASIAKVVINGVTYDGSSKTTINVKVGDVIECYVNGSRSGYIQVNGVQVMTSDVMTYEYIVTTNCTVSVEGYEFQLFGTQTAGYIVITEQ